MQEALDAQKEGARRAHRSDAQARKKTRDAPPSLFETRSAFLRPARAEFQRREATFKRREEMLKKKDLELQESLIKFNKFLQENDSKRNRAEKKQTDEKKQKQLKEQEISERTSKGVEATQTPRA